ncbi:MAG: insulinase family protein [Verrucomicrobia bacterium]|nr:insulinase family protein [Verrucomicrobiota bacterium]
MPDRASVSLGVWVGVGGRYEPAELNGVSHFIEHLLFKGTRKRSAKRISQDVEGLGGYLNAFTAEENTCYFSRARHDRFDDLLEVVADMLLNSRLDPVEIDKEREVIKEELAMYLDQPQHHVHELLNELLWPDQPLGRSLTGTEQTLEAMRRAHLVGYLKTHYVAAGTLVAAAGNLRHTRVVQAVKAYAAKLPAGRRPGFAPATCDQRAPRLRLFTKATEQTQVAIGFRACSRHDERRYALRLLNTLLGENMSSRLFQIVREDHGLAYSIGSSLGFFDDVGVLTISAGVETDKLPRALRLVARELRRLVDSPPGAAELRRARDYVIGQMDLSLENAENQMMWIGEQWLGYGKVFQPGEVRARLAEVTPAQIRGVARDFLRPDRLSLALVSPLKSSARLNSLLAF